MIDVAHAPRRYRYRLIGTELAAFAGRDMTGHTIDRWLYGAYADMMCRRSSQVVDNMAPHVAFSTAH